MATKKTDKIMQFLCIGTFVTFLVYIALYWIPGFYTIENFFNTDTGEIETVTPSLGYSIWIDVSYYQTYGFKMNFFNSNEFNFIADPIVISMVGAVVIMVLTTKWNGYLPTHVCSALWVLYTTIAYPLMVFTPLDKFNDWASLFYKPGYTAYKITSTFCMWEQGDKVILVALLALIAIADVFLVLRCIRFMKGYIAKKKEQAAYRKRA